MSLSKDGPFFLKDGTFSEPLFRKVLKCRWPHCRACQHETEVAMISRMNSQSPKGGSKSLLLKPEFFVLLVLCLPGFANPQAAPHAATASIRNAVLVETETVNGEFYQLQRSIDLRSWNDIGIPFEGDGGRFSFPFPTEDIKTRWFRFLVVGNLPLRLALVTVSDESNPADTVSMEDDGTSGYGTVTYRYRCGRYEVTNAEYAAFLQSIAASDAHALYNTKMGTSRFGGIVRSGTDGSYNYAVKTRQSGYDDDYGRKPVVFVSLYDCLRFCNWLHNGGTSRSSTEEGAYNLTTGQAPNAVIPRSGDARYFLLNENEWYKAAYYKHGTGTSGYWLYPTRTDIAPVPGAPTSLTNFANCGSAVNFLTDVGEYANSQSPYGTFDQGGNVLERLENGIVRGGNYQNSSQVLRSARRLVSWNTPLAETEEAGFRIGTRTDFPPLH